MTLEKFSLEGKLIAITGGSGLLGSEHSEAVAEIGGVPLILDIDEVKNAAAEKNL